MDSIIGLPSVEALTTLVNSYQNDPKLFRGQEILKVEPEYSPDIIQWDIKGPIYGMTKAHVLDADPQIIGFPTLSRKSVRTAFWKEASLLDESTLLKVRAAGTYNQRAGRQLVTERTLQHAIRLDTRVEWCIWQALSGTLTIDENAVKRTIDYEIPSDNKDTTSTSWSNVASDIIGDLRAWAQLFHDNHTGAGMPTAWINSTQAGYMCLNTAIKAVVAGTNAALQVNLANIAALVTMMVGNIAGIEIYDGEYTSDAGSYTKFIPNTSVILIGKGPASEPFGAFKSTLSLHNGGIDNPQPGKFAFYKDETASELNPKITQGAGIYGLPVIYHPNWIVIGTITTG